MYKLLFVLFLTGCGFYPTHSGYVDPEFTQYVNEYKQDKLKYLGTDKIKTISVTFKKIKDVNDGVCDIETHYNRITKKALATFRMIHINYNYWSVYTDISRKILIYHELGHCDLGLNHSNENTIMNPYGIDDSVFLSNPNYYLDLLFNKGK